MDELSNKEVRTRKAHTCIWCGESIGKGERAQARSYVFDGRLMSDHLHTECYEAMGKYDWDACVDEGFEPYIFHRGLPIENWEPTNALIGRELRGGGMT